MKALLQQALDALEYHVQQTRPIHQTTLAIEAIRAELAKPEQVLRAWIFLQNNELLWPDEVEHKTPCKATGYIPLYTAPTEPNCKFPTCHSQEYQNKLVQEILEPTNGYVQPVPDKCDRIVWPNKYYHLPL